MGAAELAAVRDFLRGGIGPGAEGSHPQCMSHSLFRPHIIEVITILDRGRFNHHRLLVTVGIDSAR